MQGRHAIGVIEDFREPRTQQMPCYDSRIKQSMIDLHTHSTASDGTLTPTDLVRYAKQKGIEVLALTDHDTLSGLEEAIEEARRIDLDFIPGVEISAEFEPGTLHILGYFVDHDDSGLEERLSWLREGRDSRNVVILRKLAELGYPLKMEEVLHFAQGQSAGRPHIADAMVRRGYVSGRDEAFDRFLAKGAPAYADKERMTPEAAIGMIMGSGGLAVLAHPQWLLLDDDALVKMVADLKEKGLAGLETFYYSHSREESAFYERIARENGLLITGGSDYHGPGGLKGTEIGVGDGGMRLPREMADRLFEVHGKG